MSTAGGRVVSTVETPDMVYGRLLESAHISGYGFERMTRELESLLQSDDWRSVGSGFDDVNSFLRTIDLSAFNLDNKKHLHKRIKELQPEASTRAIGKATGTPHTTVQDHVKNGVRNRTEPDLESAAPADSGTDDVRNRTEQTPNSLQRSPAEIAKHADKAARKDQGAAATKARREASRNAAPIPDGVDLRIGDAREKLTDVADDSVALVLTDPPYGDAAEPLYQWLAEWAARVLVPGGSLICYTGHSRLDRDMSILGGHLRYWWLLSMLHHQSQRLPGKFVTVEFKPVMWFVKQHRRGRTLVNDVLRSPKREKDAHGWGQGEGGVPLLYEQLTEPGELIADPFAGTARWGAIAAEMGRLWIGADIVQGGTEEVHA